MLARYTNLFAILVAVVGITLMSASVGYCQDGGAGDGGDGGGADGGGDGGDDGDDLMGGIEIDANGVLSTRRIAGNVRQLNFQRAAAAQNVVNKDLQKPSEFRKISLTRLEREVEELIKAGKPIPADMKFLAGMTKITHVFLYPESKDIVIAGPAEGYFVTADGHVVGMQSGRATLQLQDLVAALRCFDAAGKKTRLISVSIDPTQQGLANFQATYTQILKSRQFRPGLEDEVTRLYREALGMQNITIQGVSNKTHFARVLAEADYEMKLIGIGLKNMDRGYKITSFIEKATARTVSKNSLVRWFFQPDYDSVQVNEDETAMQLVGSGVKLVGGDESVAKTGKRSQVVGVNRASQVFCNTFTRAYPKLAENEPLWAELRNLMDLSVVAAFIQEMDLYGQAEWEMKTFGDEAKFPIENYRAPTKVAPLTNSVWKGNTFMSPIAGGVSIRPRAALSAERLKVDNEGKIDNAKDSVNLNNLAPGTWWWD